MDDRPKEDDVKKKPYEKPEVRRVPLRPEEAVLGFCKSVSIAGPLYSPCTTSLTCPQSGS
jgi:hypothetical protein